jgi:hypothetical protein
MLGKAKSETSVNPGICSAKEPKRPEPAKRATLAWPVGQGETKHHHRRPLDDGKPTEQDADNDENPAG